MKVHSYCTNSGKDLIFEYIDFLSDEERIDAFSVLECMEKAEFEKFFINVGRRKFMKYIFESIIEYSML